MDNPTEICYNVSERRFPMDNSDKTLLLIVVVALFTIAFVSSAIITYRIKRKKSIQKSKSTERKDLTE